VPETGDSVWRDGNKCVHGWDSVGCSSACIVIHFAWAGLGELQRCRDEKQCTSDRNGTAFWCQKSGHGSAGMVKTAWRDEMMMQLWVHDSADARGRRDGTRAHAVDLGELGTTKGHRTRRDGEHG